MLHPPFERVREFVERTFREPERTHFGEYLQAVAYHLDFAERARDACSSILFLNSNRVRIDVLDGEEEAFLAGFSPGDLVRFGDVAIRECASVVELALLLTNHVLGLGIRQERVNWNSENQPSVSVKAQLTRLPNGQGDGLVAAIGAVWESAGRELLSRYRNWVTHRGAPRVLCDAAYDHPLPIPTHIRSIDDPGEREFDLQGYYLERIREGVQVQCAAFHPTVAAILSRVDDAGNQVDMRVASGSLLDNEAEYRARNQVTTDVGRIMVGGEELATYRVGDYLNAVNLSVRFVGKAVTGAWDEQMLLLLQQRVTV